MNTFFLMTRLQVKFDLFFNKTQTNQLKLIGFDLYSDSLPIKFNRMFIRRKLDAFFVTINSNLFECKILSFNLNFEKEKSLELVEV